MGWHHPAAGCTLLCMLAVHGLSVGLGKIGRGIRTARAPHFTGQPGSFPPFLRVFLQHQGNGPTSLRKGEGHLVVIVVQRGWW